jgi:hypothetical protein
MNVPKIVPVNLAKSLKEASQAHADVKSLIAEHARAATEHRRIAHDRLLAENQLTQGVN